MNYNSCEVFESTATPGVRLHLRRMSFGRRLELTRALRDTVERMDQALAAPAGEVRDADAAALAAEADAACLRWAVEKIEGLEIDGQPATIDSLLSAGPEELVQEILARMRAGIGLSETERKNSASPSISCAAGQQGRASDGSATPAAASDSFAAATAAAVFPGSTTPQVLPSPSGCGEARPAIGACRWTSARPAS